MRCVGTHASGAFAQLEFLLGVTVGRQPRALAGFGFRDGDEFHTGNAFGVIGEFFFVHVAAGKQRPPGRLGGTTVEVEHLRHQYMKLLLVITVGFGFRYAGHEALFIAGEPCFVCVNLVAFLSFRLGGGIVFGPLGGLRLEAQEPVMQQIGRTAVVFVVVANLAQQIVFARLAPLFVIDDAGAGAGHFPFALGHVEGFDVLDRIARLGYADGFAHDLVEIDESFLAQQLVDLGFAYAVQGHQALDGSDFVVGVVVDVRSGVLAQMIGHKIDKGGEGSLLLGAIVCPEVAIDPLSFVAQANAKQVFEPTLLQRVAFHIEEEITFIRHRQAVEAG